MQRIRLKSHQAGYPLSSSTRSLGITWSKCWAASSRSPRRFGEITASMVILLKTSKSWDTLAMAEGRPCRTRHWPKCSAIAFIWGNRVVDPSIANNQVPFPECVLTVNNLGLIKPGIITADELPPSVCLQWNIPYEQIAYKDRKKVYRYSCYASIWILNYIFG